MTPKQRLAAAERLILPNKADQFPPDVAAMYRRIGLDMKPGHPRQQTPETIRTLGRILDGHRAPDMTDADMEWIQQANRFLEDELI